MSRAIGILSGKGGVGKTTITANLGAALTRIFRKNIVIFDTNVHASHLGLHLGMYEDPPVTLRDVLLSRVPILHAVYMHPPTGIRIIPAPLNGKCGDVIRFKVRDLVKQVKSNYDTVLLDCAPGLGKEVVSAISAVDEALVVTTPDIPAVTDAMKTLDFLRKMNKHVLGVVMNRCDNEYYTLTQKEIESTCNCSVISKIPEDKKIPESISRGVPAVLLYPNCAASKSLKSLAGNLAGETYYEKNMWDRIKNFLGFGRVLPQFEREIPEIGQEQKEIADVERMRKGLTDEMRRELKREIIERVRGRLREKHEI